MSRPRGPIREALARAAQELVPPDAPAGQGVTWRELVRHARVGELVGRSCVVDMQRAGELVVVGTRALRGVSRPANVFAPRREPAMDAAAALVQAVRSWAEFPPA